MKIRLLVSVLYVLSVLFPPAAALAATGCTYPATLDTWADKAAGDFWTVADVNTRTCGIEDVMAELGLLPKGTYASVRARLDDAIYKSTANTYTGGGLQDFSAMKLSLPASATLPGTCTANKEVYIDTDAATFGGVPHICNASGTGWNPIGGLIFADLQRTIAAFITAYCAPYPWAVCNSTETLISVIAPIGGTAKNLYVKTSGAQPSGGSLVVTVRKNGAATALTVTIAASAAAGIYTNVTDSFSFVAGDLLAIQYVNNADQAAAFVVSTTFGG